MAVALKKVSVYIVDSYFSFFFTADVQKKRWPLNPHGTQATFQVTHSNANKIYIILGNTLQTGPSNMIPVVYFQKSLSMSPIASLRTTCPCGRDMPLAVLFLGFSGMIALLLEEFTNLQRRRSGDEVGENPSCIRENIP